MSRFPRVSEGRYAPIERILRGALRFWSKVNKSPGLGPNGDCWEWTAARTRLGYGSIWYDTTDVFAHRMAFFFHNGRWPNPETPCVLHKCDNPPCVRWGHLKEGTHFDNMQDKVGKFIGPRSLREPRIRGAKLNSQQVLDIRRKRQEGYSYFELSLEYGVTSGHIGNILSGTVWKNV
jgi:hypothetical protein